MKFPAPLIPGTLVQRYKRFLADIILDTGEAITASCPNTGAMLGLTAPGSRVWVSHNTIPTRKYRYTLEIVESGSPTASTLVGINTGLPNRIVAEAILEGRIESLTGYSNLRNEVKYGINSRIDILLSNAGKCDCYVEIKNAHLMRTPGRAEFPDSITARGAKHLAELSAMVQAGKRAVMVYLVQRADAVSFSVASDIDPAYAAAVASAHQAGVEAIALRCILTPYEIVTGGLIDIV